MISKTRISSTIVNSFPIGKHEKGTYAMFYLIGEDLPTKIAAATKKVGSIRFSKATVSELIKLGVLVKAKAGTVGPRSGVPENQAYNKRSGELLSNFTKCNKGKLDAMDLATQTVWQHLVEFPKQNCVMLMAALYKHPAHLLDSDIEKIAEDYIKDNFGIEVENSPGSFKKKDVSRWAKNNINLTFIP